MNNDKNKAKFTPGPWTVRKDGLGIDNKRHKIFDVSTGLEPKKEDAHLIAAAPDMFEALEQALEAIVYYCNKLDIVYQDEEEFIKIEAAIAKARGES